MAPGASRSMAHARLTGGPALRPHKASNVNSAPTFLSLSIVSMHAVPGVDGVPAQSPVQQMGSLQVGEGVSVTTVPLVYVCEHFTVPKETPAQSLMGGLMLISAALN